MDALKLSRRHFLALGAAGVLLPSRPAFAEGDSTPKSGGHAIEKGPLRLTPLEIPVGASRPFTVLHASDSHLNFMTVDDLNDTKYGDLLEFYRARRTMDAMPPLAALVKEARTRKLPVFHTGDLIDYESQANLSLARQSFAGVDVLFAPGNHEYVGHWGRKAPNWSECREARQRIGRFFPNDLTVASRVINGVNFVAFDNGGLSFGLEKQQLAAIKKEFAKGLPLVLLCHLPLYTKELYVAFTESTGPRAGEKSVKKETMPWILCGMHAAEKPLLAYLAKQPLLKAVLCGHLHREYQFAFTDSVTQYVADATYKGNAYEITFS